MGNKTRLNYTQFTEKISKEEFINYYSNHNIFITAEYYNTIPRVISQYCKNIGYKKDKIKETIQKIDKDTLKNFYLNHTYQETLNHFNLTPYKLSKLLKFYNIFKCIK